MLRRGIVVIAFCLFLFPQSLLAQENVDLVEKGKYEVESIVARVNDRIITSDQLYQKLFKMGGEQMLGQMITEMLIEDDAEARKIEISQKELEQKAEEFESEFPDRSQYEQWLGSQKLTEDELMGQLKLNMLQEKLIVEARGLSVTEDEVEMFFEGNKENLGTPEQLRCSHILVETQAEAEEVLLALEAGANFAKLAVLKSKDAESRENGGDIGFFQPGMIFPEFEQAAAALKIEETSGVVATRAGFHVIKLTERNDAVPATFDKKTKADVSEFILRQKVGEALPDFMKELQAKASISVFPEIQPGK